MFEFFDSQASLSRIADPDRIEERQQFGELRIPQSGARSRRVQWLKRYATCFTQSVRPNRNVLP
jgi:hypothetical protein